MELIPRADHCAMVFSIRFPLPWVMAALGWLLVGDRLLAQTPPLGSPFPPAIFFPDPQGPPLISVPPPPVANGDNGPPPSPAPRAQTPPSTMAPNPAPDGVPTLIQFGDPLPNPTQN